MATVDTATTQNPHRSQNTNRELSGSGGSEVSERVISPLPAFDQGFYSNAYYRDLAQLHVHNPEEEFEAARKIEQQEIALWNQIFSYQPLVELFCSVVRRQAEDAAPQLDMLLSRARAARKKSSVACRNKYVSACAKVAAQVHAADQDRVALLDITDKLQRIASGEHVWSGKAPLAIKPRSKAFQTYYRKVCAQLASTDRLRNDFIQANLRLVVSIARRFHRGVMPLNDMIQEGNLGLIKAVERYDYRKGYRFSTYASWWIRHAISRAIADKGRAVRLPVHMLEVRHRISHATKELSVKLGRTPLDEEISQVVGISVDKFRKIQQHSDSQALSLDRTVSNEDDRKFVEMLHDPDATTPGDALALETMTNQLRQVLQNLKPMEVDILSRRFGLTGEDQQTLRAIGEDYQLSRERIRQIQERALTKIRHALECRRAI